MYQDTPHGLLCWAMCALLLITLGAHWAPGMALGLVASLALWGRDEDSAGGSADHH